MICVLMLLEHVLVLGKTTYWNRGSRPKRSNGSDPKNRANDGSGSCGITKIFIPFTQFVTLEDCMLKPRLFF